MLLQNHFPSCIMSSIIPTNYTVHNIWSFPCRFQPRLRRLKKFINDVYKTTIALNSWNMLFSICTMSSSKKNYPSQKISSGHELSDFWVLFHYCLELWRSSRISSFIVWGSWMINVLYHSVIQCECLNTRCRRWWRDFYIAEVGSPGEAEMLRPKGF